MLNIEEYIAKRKKEDGLNEFDIEKRFENIKLCVDYVFEYFNNYLSITEVEHQTILNNEKLDKYRQQIREYDKDVQDWLVGFCNEYGKYMQRNIGSILDDNEIFLLYNTDAEFRNASYDCYSKLIKKYPFLKEQSEMLFLFVKDYQRVKSISIMKLNEFLFMNQYINDWIDKTCAKYNVSIPAFACQYIERFFDSKDKWPSTHKKKSHDSYSQYDYDYKQKKNLFNLDTIYPKVSNKAFLKGHKQELELVMMYYWLHNIETDDEYWQEYLEKVLPSFS